MCYFVVHPWGLGIWVGEGSDCKGGNGEVDGWMEGAVDVHMYLVSFLISQTE